jgi:cytochrome c oxidase subunit I
VFHGLAQALSYANIDILSYFPGLRGYYQGLTVHGVANVLIFTFSFSNGFLVLMVARALSRPLTRAALGEFGALVVGNLLTIYAVVTNQASVLYTSYAPLQAHWAYYLGLSLVVVSTWLALLNMWLVMSALALGPRNCGFRCSPSSRLVSYVMWLLASLPIAVSVPRLPAPVVARARPEDRTRS